jgi:biotin carboxyl carrier protein
LIAYPCWVSPVLAQEAACPPGPFETDRDKIAAALTALPALSPKLSRERRSFVRPEAWRFTDGVATEGGGGLNFAREGQPVILSVRTEYDATHYLSRHVVTQALRGEQYYFTSLLRPTGEEARNIACLANQLLRPAVSPATEEPSTAQKPTSAEAAVTAQPPRCEIEYSDGHWETFDLRVGGTAATISQALSCGDAERLRSLLTGAVYAPFAKAGL